MVFELVHLTPTDIEDMLPHWTKPLPEDGWAWYATSANEGVVFRAPQTIYATEAEARSAIAKARKACAGARFARVVQS